MNTIELMVACSKDMTDKEFWRSTPNELMAMSECAKRHMDIGIPLADAVMLAVAMWRERGDK